MGLHQGPCSRPGGLQHRKLFTHFCPRKAIPAHICQTTSPDLEVGGPHYEGFPKRRSRGVSVGLVICRYSCVAGLPHCSPSIFSSTLVAQPLGPKTAGLTTHDPLGARSGTTGHSLPNSHVSLGLRTLPEQSPTFSCGSHVPPALGEKVPCRNFS